MANWHSPTKLWLDHAEVREDDLEWMAPVKSLVLWNVRLPDQALARLPDLAGLSVRGGTGSDLTALRGCESLLCLDINQVRGLHDLSEIRNLRSLEFLSVYGQPRVKALPSLGEHTQLRHVQLGSMKGLDTLAGVVAAPQLKTLEFIRAVNFSEQDVLAIAEHPTLQAFGWFWEDVPDRVALPVLNQLRHLERPEAISPDNWLDRRLAAT